MSISFTMKVEVKSNYYFDNGNLEKSFTTMTTELDLGNFRAYRSICPIQEGRCIEECGSIVMDSREGDAYLFHHLEIDCPQVKAAYCYLENLRKSLAGIIDCDQPEASIICTISWC